MTKLLEANDKLEDRWLPRAMANFLGPDGAGRYGHYKDLLIHRVKTIQAFDADLTRTSWYSRKPDQVKIAKGVDAMAVKIFKKMKEEEFWEIYIPNQDATLKVTEEDLEKYVEYNPYDATMFDSVVALFTGKDYKHTFFDRSSNIDTSLNRPHIKLSIRNGKDFKCAVKYDGWDKRYNLEAEIYGSRFFNNSVRTLKDVEKVISTEYIPRFEELKKNGAFTFEYNGMNVELSPRAASSLVSQTYQMFYLPVGDWVLEFAPDKLSNVKKNLGADYNMPVVEIKNLKRVVFAALPTQFLNSEYHAPLFKGKKLLKQ